MRGRGDERRERVARASSHADPRLMSFLERFIIMFNNPNSGEPARYGPGLLGGRGCEAINVGDVAHLLGATARPMSDDDTNKSARAVAWALSQPKERRQAKSRVGPIREREVTLSVSPSPHRWNRADPQRAPAEALVSPIRQSDATAARLANASTASSSKNAYESP